MAEKAKRRHEKLESKRGRGRAHESNARAAQGEILEIAGAVAERAFDLDNNQLTLGAKQKPGKRDVTRREARTKMWNILQICGYFAQCILILSKWMCKVTRGTAKQKQSKSKAKAKEKQSKPKQKQS